MGMLDDVTVLDLTTILAGPFAAYQLGLFGANVIKVEVPTSGDPARELGSEHAGHISGMGPSFVAQNAGKRSVALNLKTNGGSAVFAELVRDADVLLENMRPGVLARLGFPWERLHQLNPRLIYCALSGFGQDGPLAGRPAYDQIVQGLAGMADVTGTPDGGPLRAGFPIADTLGGFAAAMGICAALAQRQADGEGVFLDVSMLDTALTAMGWAVSNYLVGGQAADRHGNDNVTSSPSGTFQTGDGPLNIAANTQEQFESVCRVLGCEALTGDPRFQTRAGRKQHRAALTDLLEARLAHRGAVEWEAALSDANVPAGRVLTVAEALEQEQIRARGLIHEVAIPGGPITRVLGNGVHVNGTALTPASGPPLLGEHTAEVLGSLGYTAEAVEELRAQGAA